MKKASKFLCLVLAATFVLTLALFAACNTAHDHTFSQEWSHDETSHWHAATCEHGDQVADKANHDFDADGRCLTCGYQRGSLSEDDPNHTHSYTTSWWSDETNHWHAATCKHTDEKSDVAAHMFNDKGRCTVCGYLDESKIKYNTQLTAEQFASAMAAVAKEESFTTTIVNPDEMSGYGCVEGQYVYARVEYENVEEYESPVVELYERVDGDDYLSAMVALGVISYSPSAGEYFILKEGFAEVCENFLPRLTFDKLTWNAERDCYAAQLGEGDKTESVEIELKFVGDRVYYINLINCRLDGYLRTFTDIGNTKVYSILDHDHDLSTYYETSAMYHWYAVRCQRHTDEIIEKQLHTFVDNKCSVCGYIKTSGVSREVTEQQWQKALAVKGIKNYAVDLSNEGVLLELFELERDKVHEQHGENPLQATYAAREGENYLYYTINSNDEPMCFTYPWYAYFSYRSMIEMYATLVIGIADHFEEFVFDSATNT